jgi:ABC-type uncharacterized transport system substrate-binding protein
MGLPAKILALCTTVAIAFASQSLAFAQSNLPKCMFVSSYHQGYAWSDGVERGLREVLTQRCEIRQINLDSKRQTDEGSKRSAAATAREQIDEWQPDVVVVADDTAIKYLLQAHYKDQSLPFVFCGVNWSAAQYGLPYANTTGMIEVAPLRPMLEHAVTISGGRKALYIGANTPGEASNLEYASAAAQTIGVTLDSVLVETMDEWEIAFRENSAYNFVIIGSNAGVAHWDDARALQIARDHGQRLTATNHPWMTPFSMLGFTQLAEEQGEWAGELVLEILAGTSPGDIPIIANRKSDIWLNEPLLLAATIDVPPSLRFRAKRLGDG